MAAPSLDFMMANSLSDAETVPDVCFQTMPPWQAPVS